MSNAFTAENIIYPYHKNKAKNQTHRAVQTLQDAPTVTLGDQSCMTDVAWQVTVTNPTITLISVAKSIRRLCATNRTVSVKITNSRKSMEEGGAIGVGQTCNAPPRLARIFGVCGGLTQHWQPDGQIQFKQSVLAELLEHKPSRTLASPLVADRLGATAPRHVWACLC